MSKRIKGYITHLLIVVMILTSIIYTDVYAEAPLGPNDTIAKVSKGIGYMGWQSTYDQQFSKKGLDETRLKSQIDYMAENMLSYGYNYVCMDGWIAGGKRHNEDGYVTTFNDSWAQDYSYWTSYAHSKGMKLGMYYSPLWVRKDIADDVTNKIVGTDIPILNICHPTVEKRSFEGWYLIDPILPGAKEYIQGMVKYYSGIGVDLLKIDFIRLTESEYGHDAITQAYKWMREAAGDKIWLSFCNQQGIGHQAEERLYADSVRMTDDYTNKIKEGYNGFWYSTSTRGAGKMKQYWPETHNTFDGVTWLSDLTGPDKLVLSPDFVALQNATSDDEKKTAVSIRFLAGSAVEVGESFDAMDSNLSFWTNPELCDLNKQGFIGKPLARVIVPKDSNYARSQIWTGQLPNGDYVVGLFNRSDTEQERSIDYQADLGLSGSFATRDMWTHSNLGSMTSYSASIPAHGCVILKVTHPVSRLKR